MKSPKEIFGGLFFDLHLSKIWSDGKFISDAIPKISPKIILKNYEEEKSKPHFDLKAFFETHFWAAPQASTNFKSDLNKPIKAHIESLWKVLQRKADTAIEGSSLIPLPHPYIVPGGRFNEIYYWDSYFTMLGLAESKRFDLIESMLDNFAYLIDEIGFIPNGNRTYFLSRSQPPFFALMVDLLQKEKGDQILLKYLPQLKREYDFWMDGANFITKEKATTWFKQTHFGGQTNPVYKRVVLTPSGEVFNRYYDRDHTPRQEMYATDIDDVTEMIAPHEHFYLNIRSACESGWDFSSRWFADGKNIHSIYTSNILPVDLNCLLYCLELKLEEGFNKKNKKALADTFHKKSIARKKWIQTNCWDENAGFFFDYHWGWNRRTEALTLAGAFPLFCKIATKEQAQKCAAVLENKFLKAGGLVTTLSNSGQQWDAPNGWAPLQWVGIQGLRNYGFEDLAKEISNRWTKLNKDVYRRTGKMLEKYNVEDLSLLSGGGEYPVQDGFGWTNGVYLRLNANS